ncbi:MAG: class I SAM-dependent methyltransferase [Acidobacteriota bacterium]
MEQFSADWLALREPADHAARAHDLTAAVAASVAQRPGLRAVDLAAGTGSNVRYLMPRVPHIQHWTLVDHDPALLAQAWRLLLPVGQTAGRAYDVRTGDLAAIDQVGLDGCALVTASALLDLVSEPWVRNLARHCRAAAVDVLFALSYDGRIACDPVDADDERVRAYVNQHQRGDKGFGRALGPDAAHVAEACFRAEGYTVQLASSDWIVTPDRRELQRQLVEGWASAATAMAPADAATIDAWREQRVAHIDEGRSTLRVGHQDLAGAPPTGL